MPEFVFMLTHDDATVEDAFEVYDEVRDTGLHFIGFKDVGPPRPAEGPDGGHARGRPRGHARGRQRKEGGRAPLGGGGPRPRGRLPARRHPCREVTRMLSGTGIRYYPSPAASSATRASCAAASRRSRRARGTGGDGRRGRLGPSGLPPRRRRGEAGAVGGRVGRSTRYSRGQRGQRREDRTLADAGVWGFTVGSAIFEGKFAHHGASTREQVETVLAASRPVAS